MGTKRQKNKEWLDCNGWEDLTDKDGNCYYKESTVLDILEKALKQVKNNDLLHSVSNPKELLICPNCKSEHVYIKNDDYRKCYCPACKHSWANL